jgi:hypothetical protein
MLGNLARWWKFREAVKASRNTGSAHPGARDIVVLPCWRRPEFLWHCLDNISRAEGSADLTVMLRPDTGFSTDNLEIARSFADRLQIEISHATPAPYKRTKQSANVLLGYLHAAASAKQYVFLIEEDVMVGRDFFRWHREVQSAVANPLFCSIGTRNPNRTLTLPDDVTAYYLSSGDFCSIGVCFDKEILQEKVAPHVNMTYMAKPKKYIRRHFKNSRIGLGFVEQDGLIRRIQEQTALPIAWPCVPRGFHAGFYGYNRAGRVEGDLQTRISTLTETIYDINLMREADSLPCELQLPAWKELHLIDVAS